VSSFGAAVPPAFALAAQGRSIDGNAEKRAKLALQG
jgi:hypothetical protein